MGIYRGTGKPHHGIDRLPEPPSWRKFSGAPSEPAPMGEDPSTKRRLGEYWDRHEPAKGEVDLVNAALLVRRPLLVTGPPGVGKSTLPYVVARELQLGRVLRWPISSRTSARDGLYRYDAVGRLREENIRKLRREVSGEAHADDETTDIGRHLRLGPLGTALLPYDRPRVLLIDEVDKCDADLPNDLLNVFEEGEFEIDELRRLTDPTVKVMTDDPEGSAIVTGGVVRCRQFPFIVLTSNGERSFPEAFLRRCLSLDLDRPTRIQIESMVRAHLAPGDHDEVEELIDDFIAQQKKGILSVDRLFNAIYVVTSGSRSTGSRSETADREGMISAFLRSDGER